MRLLLAALLASALGAGEAADPSADLIAAGFAAWTAGDGKAACAVWAEGALPAAGAEADLVAKRLDAVPAAARGRPAMNGPWPTTLEANGVRTTSSIYTAAVEAGAQSVLVAFAFTGSPPRLAAMTSGTGNLNRLLQDKVKMSLMTALSGGRTFNPGRRSEMAQVPRMVEDPLGPYVITAPAGVKIGRLVVWGPAIGAPVEIPIGDELSLVSLAFTAGDKPTLTCSWTPASGAGGSRELPVQGALPDRSGRSVRSTTAGTRDQIDAKAARSRDPLPAAWSAWFELSWGAPPEGLSEEEIISAQLPQAVLVTLE